mmetsp:Transcript_112703/g.318485  ORF Transcript_112703/g.318485 Transcript_112703/m.318485 type:complete len:587 (+) Transcript_112703:190-1950(+)
MGAPALKRGGSGLHLFGGRRRRAAKERLQRFGSPSAHFTSAVLSSTLLSCRLHGRRNVRAAFVPSRCGRSRATVWTRSAGGRCAVEPSVPNTSSARGSTSRSSWAGAASPSWALIPVGRLASALLGAAVAAASSWRIARRRKVAATSLLAESASTIADFNELRKDFPTLDLEVRPGVPLIYLDSAATSQKPRRVLKELERFYCESNSNVHRGMHTLSILATDAFEGARTKLANFIGAADPMEVIFTRNATEAINIVARTWARAELQPGDEIVLTVMEHHSNLVPWQQVAQETGAKLRFAGLTSDGVLDREQLESLIGPRTRLVSLCHVSNVLGCTNPIEWVVERAHAVGARVLVDACQSVPHMVINVQALGADWVVGSGHKMCGPTGVGFLWGRAELLRSAPPFLGGGEMIDEVSLESSTYADIPHKFEAGTPAFAEAVALGAACDYLTEVGMDRVHSYERALSEHLWRRVGDIPGAVLYGPPPTFASSGDEAVGSAGSGRAALVSFNIQGCHPHDIATMADQDIGVAMRAGHHCCQPLHRELGVTASARLSAYFYNTLDEIDVAVDAVRSAAELLKSIGNSSVAI